MAYTLLQLLVSSTGGANEVFFNHENIFISSFFIFSFNHENILNVWLRKVQNDQVFRAIYDIWQKSRLSCCERL